MTFKAALCATVLASAMLLAAPASATTLVTSLAAFQAGAGGTVSSTPNPGPFDLGQLDLPLTSTIKLNSGATLGLSAIAQVTAPQNGFPYLLNSGFGGELFIPQDSQGNPVTSETITFGSAVSALGFEIAPFSSATAVPFTGFPGGPFNVTITLATGQTSTVSLPGGNFNTGKTTSRFVGFTGGGVSSVTISTTDPNGLAFGNFVDVSTSVPEPASAALLLAGIAGLLMRRRSALA